MFLQKKSINWHFYKVTLNPKLGLSLTPNSECDINISKEFITSHSKLVFNLSLGLVVNPNETVGILIDEKNVG